LKHIVFLDLLIGSVTALGLVVVGHRCAVSPACWVVEGGGLVLLCHIVVSTEWNED
jgi:hypothetical protein